MESLFVEPEESKDPPVDHTASLPYKKKVKKAEQETEEKRR